MNLTEYQALALRTDQTPLTDAKSVDTARLIPLLGLAGEAGQLLAEYKKRLRDGASHTLFVNRVAEELGDMLWYLANLASKYDLDLNEIAQQNLAKVANRYLHVDSATHYDAKHDSSEQLPRRFIITFREIRDGQRAEVRTEIDGKLVGSALTDNAYTDDGYRFHDIFHVAYATILGWSPVIRSLLRLKRRSTPMIDEVEDGGRAVVIEEGIAAAAFDYARRHHFLVNVFDVDDALLSTIRGMGAHLEVAAQPASAWRLAILEGFKVWRDLVKNCGGTVFADLDKRELRYFPPAESATTTAAALNPE